jgi:PEGA domain
MARPRHNTLRGRRCALLLAALLLAALALPLLISAACGPHTGVKSAQALGGLLMACEPADALLYVDDKYMGTVAGLATKPLALPVGPHRLELRKEGYFAHFAEITVAKGLRHKLEVKLRKEPF